MYSVIKNVMFKALEEKFIVYKSYEFQDVCDKSNLRVLLHFTCMRFMLKICEKVSSQSEIDPVKMKSQK
jgi:hypothetical protein